MTLAGFPVRTLRGDREIHRIHRAGNDPWHFSADGRGRFDPIGTGTGACYFADRPLGAWVEVFRKPLLLDEADVDARRLTTVSIGCDVRLADLVSRRALGFGVTASLGAGEDYGPSQAFAARAFAAGFAGVRYLVRHDPAQRLVGYALFGGDDETGRPAGSVTRIPDAVRDEAAATFRYRIVPRP